MKDQQYSSIVYNSKNKKIGQINVIKEGNNLNLDYVRVKKKYRQKDYAGTIMKNIDQIAKNKKVSTLTGDVVSPHMMKIVEKNGFTKVKDIKKQNEALGVYIEKKLK